MIEKSVYQYLKKTFLCKKKNELSILSIKPVVYSYITSIFFYPTKLLPVPGKTLHYNLPVKV